MDEALDRLFAPRRQGKAAEAATEAADPGEAHAADFACVAVQHGDAGVTHNLRDLLLLAAFKVVIAQHSDQWNLDSAHDLAGEHARLLRQTVIRQVAADCYDV